MSVKFCRALVLFKLFSFASWRIVRKKKVSQIRSRRVVCVCVGVHNVTLGSHCATGYLSTINLIVLNVFGSDVFETLR